MYAAALAHHTLTALMLATVTSVFLVRANTDVQTDCAKRRKTMSAAAPAHHTMTALMLATVTFVFLVPVNTDAKKVPYVSY